MSFSQEKVNFLFSGGFLDPKKAFWLSVKDGRHVLKQGPPNEGGLVRMFAGKGGGGRDTWEFGCSPTTVKVVLRGPVNESGGEGTDWGGLLGWPGEVHLQGGGGLL